MTAILSLLTIWALFTSGCTVSTKMNFGDQEPIVNASTVEDEDVEVKHTIVVSTKLKNNNRRGIHSSSHGDIGTLSYNIGKDKEDSGEVPIVKGYKAVETTQIRSQDTRNKPHYSSLGFINRNARDEFDVYPNLAINPNQWKPSTFYNNINWWNQDVGREYYNLKRRNDRPIYENPGKLNRKITDDAMKEFYCKKCRECSNGEGSRGFGQQRGNQWLHETTTPKMKLDGKLAKLN